MSRTLLVIHPGTGTVLDASECVVVRTVIPGLVQEAVERGEFKPSNGRPVLDPFGIEVSEAVSIVVRLGEARPAFAIEVSPQDEGVCVDAYVADADGYCEGDPIDSLFVADSDVEVDE